MGEDLAPFQNWNIEASVMTKKEERELKKQQKLEAELLRLEGMTVYEKEYAAHGLICGIDEVGRGPLAGPVVAGAVLLPPDCSDPLSE